MVRSLLYIIVIVTLVTAPAAASLIDFEDLTDLESVTTQYPGLTFSNTITLTAGISLNEFDFPPRSGTNVVSDDGAPIEILFGSPVASFSGYFTYVLPLSLEAFDATDSSVALAMSLYSANDGFTGEVGSSPNELIEISYSGGISRLLITGDLFGGSFTMDDVSVTSVTAVPEPSEGFTILAIVIGIAFIILRERITSPKHSQT